MSVHIYTHDACLAHDTGPGHAERPQRLVAVLDALRDTFNDLEWHQAPRAGRAALLRVHAPALLDTVLEHKPQALVALDPDTMLSPHSGEAALRAAGAAVAAVDAVCGGQTRRAFCAVRPPGHHATPYAAMGFCLFNNIAVAAAHALAHHRLQRVAVIDFDVHHGNGTQHIFQDDPRVLYASSHQWPLYPGTGSSAEHGVGNLRNLPLPPGSGSACFRVAWEQTLLPVVDDFRPQLLLLSAGFDAHWRDPLAQLQLQADDFGWLTRELAAIAGRHADGRMISLLEGGYDLQALAECGVAHVGAMRDHR